MQPHVRPIGREHAPSVAHANHGPDCCTLPLSIVDLIIPGTALKYVMLVTAKLITHLCYYSNIIAISN